MSTTYESPPTVSGANGSTPRPGLPGQERGPARNAPAAPVRHVVSRQEHMAAKKALAQLEKLGTMITRALMSIGGGALIFTCANVTLFAMSHDVPWWIAWMLDPMASLALLTVLYVDGVLTEHGGKKAGTWPFLLRWFAGLSTWLMNSWTSLYPDAHFTWWPTTPDAGGLLLHSVAPLLLITLAEASTGYRSYLAKRLAVLREVIQSFEDQEHAERELREARLREEHEREVRDKREAEKAAAENGRLREAREFEERQQREQAAAMAETARIASQAEIARLREQGEQETRKAEIEVQRLREEREFEERRLLLERENEEAKAKTEADRARRESEIEERRQQREREIEDGRVKAEAAREAELIRARGTAEAERIQAEAEVRRREEADRREREREAAEAAEKVRKAQERASARQTRLASQTARTGSRNSSRSLSETASHTGAVPRELRSQLREQAEREVARLMLEGSEIDQQAIGERYAKGETWIGDRVRSAKKRLADDSDFELAVIASALEDEMPVSDETKDNDVPDEAGAQE